MIWRTIAGASAFTLVVIDIFVIVGVIRGGPPGPIIHCQALVAVFWWRWESTRKDGGSK